MQGKEKREQKFLALGARGALGVRGVDLWLKMVTRVVSSAKVMI